MKPQKSNKLRVGLETEMFMLNSEGNMVFKSDELIEFLRKETKLDKQIEEEVGLSMIEVISKPAKTIDELSKKFLGNIKKVVEKAESRGIYLLPFGCYPTKFNSRIRQKEWYINREAIIGKNNLKRTTKVCGFHFHYSMPRGLVGKKREEIKRISQSEKKDDFLSMYNLAVAIEPAAMTFCQSSPFLEGKYYGKDSRVLAYRNLSIPNEIEGIYYSLPVLGGLPHYEFTLEDLRALSIKRKNLFLDLMRSKGVKTNEIVNTSGLKFAWGPLRVNKIGTLEFRGFDMNYPSYLFSVASIISTAIEGMEMLNLRSVPSDIGLKEPFKIEDEQVYLPPYSIVKSIELLGARYGLDNTAVYNYCSNLVKFIKKISDKEQHKKLFLIEKMIEKRKTKSDDILLLVEKNGYDINNVPDEFFKYIASYLSKNYIKEIEFAEDKFSQ